MTDRLTEESIFTLIQEALSTAVGEAEAYTLQGLAEYAGTSRRMVERVLEDRLQDLGFVIVTGSAGIWRPTSAEEVNHYLRSLQSRAVKMFLRKKRIVRLASESGFPRDGKSFEDPPTKQREFLFPSMACPAVAGGEGREGTHA